MYDDSNGNVSDYEVEDLRCPSFRNNCHKLTGINSIREFYVIDLKGDKGKGGDWCCGLCKNYFKGRIETKAESHYFRYVLGNYTKSFMVAFPPEIIPQLRYSLTKKQINKDIIIRINITHNNNYKEDVESYTKNLFSRSSGPRLDTPSVESNYSFEYIFSPLITISYSSFFPIITTPLSYIEINHCPYTRKLDILQKEYNLNMSHHEYCASHVSA